MRAIGFSPEDCMRNLQSYVDEIDEILALFNEHGQVKHGKAEEAQDLLKGLKGLLRNDYEKRATNKGDKEMTEIERAFFMPAVHEALTRINVKTNSKPSGQWVRELLDAQSSIQYSIDGLRGGM